MKKFLDSQSKRGLALVCALCLPSVGFFISAAISNKEDLIKTLKSLKPVFELSSTDFVDYLVDGVAPYQEFAQLFVVNLFCCTLVVVIFVLFIIYAGNMLLVLLLIGLHVAFGYAVSYLENRFDRISFAWENQYCFYFLIVCYIVGMIVFLSLIANNMGGYYFERYVEFMFSLILWVAYISLMGLAVIGRRVEPVTYAFYHLAIMWLLWLFHELRIRSSRWW